MSPTLEQTLSWKRRAVVRRLAGEGARVIFGDTAIRPDELCFQGDPLLARHINNVVADEKPRGWRLSKPRGSRVKIDAAVAAAIAAHQARQPASKQIRSVYEDPNHRLLSV